MQSHISVLTEESVAALQLTPSSIVVDATVGAGGHAERITDSLGKSGVFVGIDVDKDAIKGVYERLTQKECSTYLQVGNFKNIDSILAQYKLTQVDAILADLGWRMEQFQGNGKGFSFQIDEPLIMTYGNPEDYPFVAKDILNEWKEEDIHNVLKGYGEERFARRIAQTICKYRKEHKIETTFQLVEIIQDAVPQRYQHGKIHPATRTFQSLRIAVNDELGTLETFIKKAVDALKPKGRLAIISFHSLEDRIVKHLFTQLSVDEVGTRITKKPIVASQVEKESNPRSRSAKLRIFEKA